MRTLDAIRNILIEQISDYRLLLDLLQQERECLITFDAMGVEDLSKEKDTIVLRLRLLEEERIRLVRKFSQENRIAEDISLKGLYELTNEDAFRMLRLQLISLLQSIEELNEFNRILIERSLFFIQNSVNFLDAFGVNINLNTSGTVLSREV